MVGLGVTLTLWYLGVQVCGSLVLWLSSACVADVGGFVSSLLSGLMFRVCCVRERCSLCVLLWLLW